jgi:hypothetical protein
MVCCSYILFPLAALYAAGGAATYRVKGQESGGKGDGRAVPLEGQEEQFN